MENKKSKKTIFLIIVSLILLVILIAIIIMIANKNTISKKNYIISGDIKINNSSKIAEAVIDKNGVIFSGFKVTEEKHKNISGEENGVLCTIDINVENKTEKLVNNKTYIVEFYDSRDNLITEYAVQIKNLRAGESKVIKERLTKEELINARTVKVSGVTM